MDPFFFILNLILNLNLNLKKMFLPTQNIRSMKCVSPPKRGAAEPVNLKIHRNPALFCQDFLCFQRVREQWFGQMVLVPNAFGIAETKEQ